MTEPGAPAADDGAVDVDLLDTRLRDDRSRPVGALAKGFTAVGDRSASELAGTAVLDALCAPFAVIRETALDSNVAAMARFCADRGLLLAPHAKTTMSPQLFARQLRAGAWGLSAAHVGQVAVYRHYGVRRMLLANELVDPVAAAWLAGEMDRDDAFCPYAWVDTVDGVDRTADAWRRAGAARPLPVLVELGFDGGRTGARTAAAALQVARRAHASGVLRVAGAAGFEGTVGSDAEAATLESVRRYCRELRRLAEDLVGEFPSGGPLLLSAGGSSYFDIVAGEFAGVDPAALTVVLRSGSYITHDDGHLDELSPYRRGAGPTFSPALEIWTRVLSRPEPDLVLACAGKRDLAYDTDLPVVTKIRRRDAGITDDVAAQQTSVTRLNDQHAFIHVPRELDLGPGDLVCLGISHPCTAFDKWRTIALVDDEYRLTDLAHTYF